MAVQIMDRFNRAVDLCLHEERYVSLIQCIGGPLRNDHSTSSYHINLPLDIGILNFEPRYKNLYCYTTNKEVLKAIFNMSLDMLLEWPFSHPHYR